MRDHSNAQCNYLHGCPGAQQSSESHTAVTVYAMLTRFPLRRNLAKTNVHVQTQVFVSNYDLLHVNCWHRTHQIFTIRWEWWNLTIRYCANLKVTAPINLLLFPETHICKFLLDLPCLENVDLGFKQPRTVRVQTWNTPCMKVEWGQSWDSPGKLLLTVNSSDSWQSLQTCSFAETKRLLFGHQKASRAVVIRTDRGYVVSCSAPQIRPPKGIFELWPFRVISHSKHLLHKPYLQHLSSCDDGCRLISRPLKIQSGSRLYGRAILGFFCYFFPNVSQWRESVIMQGRQHKYICTYRHPTVVYGRTLSIKKGIHTESISVPGQINQEYTTALYLYTWKRLEALMKTVDWYWTVVLYTKLTMVVNL